jgi:hypothetical protein
MNWTETAQIRVNIGKNILYKEINKIKSSEITYCIIFITENIRQENKQAHKLFH